MENSLKALEEAASEISNNLGKIFIEIENIRNSEDEILNLYGKTVYVQNDEQKPYLKAILLGYGKFFGYGNENWYCVKLIKQNYVAHEYVQFYGEILTQEEYDKIQKQQYPFGLCQECGYEFNSELINEYDATHCIKCGAEIELELPYN